VLTNTESKESYVFVTDDSIKGWLPGKTEVKNSIKLPDAIKSGVYDLVVGIVDKLDNKPAVYLAIESRTEDGWYPLSHIEVNGKWTLKSPFSQRHIEYDL